MFKLMISKQKFVDLIEEVFSVAIFRLPRCFQDVFKMSSRRFGRQEIVTLKTSSKHLFKICLDVVFQMLSTEKEFISVSNKSKSVSDKSLSNKSISEKSQVNPR